MKYVTGHECNRSLGKKSLRNGFARYGAANVLVRASRPREVQRYSRLTHCRLMKTMYMYMSGTVNVNCDVLAELSRTALKYVTKHKQRGWVKSRGP
jgi:hypothetical protein